MDIFPVFDEFRPYFSFQLSISTFLHNIRQNSKNFWHFAPSVALFVQFLGMEKFSAHRAI